MPIRGPDPTPIDSWDLLKTGLTTKFGTTAFMRQNNTFRLRFHVQI